MPGHIRWHFPVDAEVKERAERVLERQERDIKTLSNLLSQIDADSSLLKAWRKLRNLLRWALPPKRPQPPVQPSIPLAGRTIGQAVPFERVTQAAIAECVGH